MPRPPPAHEPEARLPYAVIGGEARQLRLGADRHHHVDALALPTDILEVVFPVGPGASVTKSS
jgi:hypothetical protein